MQHFLKTTWNRWLSLAIIIAAYDAAAASDNDIEVRAQTVIGTELRLLVETSRNYRPLFSSHSETEDAKGYLIQVDLASTKPLSERSKVIGPLWDVPNPRSTISFQIGAHFTKEDAEAAAATPMCTFDIDGTLLRFLRDAPRKTLVRYSLTLHTKGPAEWKRQGDAKFVDDRQPPGSENRIVTRSGRYLLLYQSGEAKLFDLFTGQRKEDPWLEKSFAHFLSITELRNVREFLTDDLNHLVICPLEIWNNWDGSSHIHTTFNLGGKTYKRSDVGLAYSRPSPMPKIFPRKLEAGESFLDENPREAFSLDGALYLFANDSSALRLYTSDGKKELRFASHGKPQWPLYPYLQMQHIPAKNELIIFETNPTIENKIAKGAVNIVIWDYKAGSLARYEVPTTDLFEIKGAKMRPKAVIPVK